MIRRSRLLCAVLVALAPVATARSQAPAPAPPAAVESAIKAVRARIAPDRRLIVFDITAERAPGGTVLRGDVESADARDAVLDAARAAGEGPVLDQITILPHPSLGPETAGVIRVSVANVRATAAHSAELVTQSLMGWPVRVLKRQGGWYLVHTEPDGYLGWVEELQLVRMTTRARDGWVKTPHLIVTAAHTIVRVKPDAATDPITDLVVANQVKAFGASGEWRHIELPDGRRGYVPAEDVEDYAAWQTAHRATPEGIARTAARFMGVPYLWGGTSAKGFDCSGFAKTVFHLNGIDLPRDTDQQAKMGVAVGVDTNLARLRTGDLLFFGTAASGDRPERVTHVGVHVGNREFIHASGLVRRSSLDPASSLYDDGLRKRLLHIRRVLPEGEITEP